MSRVLASRLFILGERKRELAARMPPRRAYATGTFVLVADHVCTRSMSMPAPAMLLKASLFTLERPLHDATDGIARRSSHVQDSVNLFSYWQFQARLAGDSQKRPSGPHAFRDHFHACQGLAKCAAFAKLDAHMPIAAQSACARQDEVAKSRKPAQSFPARPEGHRQPRHLRKAPRNQSCQRVRAHAQPLAGAGGDRYNILHRAGKLDSQNIFVGVQTKRRASKLFL